MNRILWNVDPGPTGGGDIDEIIIEHPALVHIEQMHDRCWWIAIYMGDSPDAPYWMGNFETDGRGRMTFSEQENAGIEWEQDRCHEDREATS